MDLVLQNTQLLPTSQPDPSPLPSPTMAAIDQPTAYMPSTDYLPTASVTPTDLPTPTPITKIYQNIVDNFKVTYKSNRQVYEEKYSAGNRHVFFNSDGNITVHVGTDWSWTNPDRNFTPDLLVSGQPTFVYSTATQKIVDFQKNNVDYTVQCVHNGLKSLMNECDQFMRDFKFLK